MALVERDGAADDLAPAAETPPQGRRDDGARVVDEPLAEARCTELPRECWRHGRAGDELRLARRCQAESARAEPAERVEARGLLLVVLQLGTDIVIIVPGLVVFTPYSDTKRSPCGYGNGRSSTPLTTVKIAVAEPMPTANATIASRATPGAVFQERQAWEKADSTSP